MVSDNSVLEFSALLRNAGYKATPLRVELLTILDRATSPLTLQELASKFRRKVDIASLYRTLHALKGAKIVQQVNFEHPHAHFELNRGDDHHHLVCTTCGKSEDVVGCDIDTLSKHVLEKSKSFKSIERHALEFFGTCATCK